MTSYLSSQDAIAYVVPTMDRRADLRNLLESLAKQTVLQIRS